MIPTALKQPCVCTSPTWQKHSDKPEEPVNWFKERTIMNIQSSSDHPQPSTQARNLVRGAYDLHVHTGPDLLPRSASDLDLAYRCRERGLAGFVIKSHYIPSAPRAAFVRLLVPEIHALGSITLNAAVGGMNPVAVEI